MLAKENIIKNIKFYIKRKLGLISLHNDITFLRQEIYPLLQNLQNAEYTSRYKETQPPSPNHPGSNPALIKILPWLKDADKVDREDFLPDSQRRFIYCLPWLEKLPKDFQTILDIGCGDGYASAFFYTRGHKVTSIDPWNYFKFCDKIRFMQARVEDMPDSQKFDAIFLSHVLEHQHNLGNFVELLKSKLSDNGYLFIIVPHSAFAEQGHVFAAWAIPQLAALLVVYGFDCRESVFQRFGYNICGFGRKTDLPTDKNFGFFKNRFDLLPSTFSQILRCNNDLYQNVSYADKNIIIRTKDIFGLSIK
jgi:SAM-dependent methyltransferase